MYEYRYLFLFYLEIGYQESPVLAFLLNDCLFLHFSFNFLCSCV